MRFLTKKKTAALLGLGILALVGVLVGRIGLPWNEKDNLDGSLGVARTSQDSNTDQFERISEREFLKNEPYSEQVLIDVRGRDAFKQGHRAVAVNIPYDELTVRAAHELPINVSIVVDCSSVPSRVCMWSARELKQTGFARIQLLYADKD